MEQEPELFANLEDFRRIYGAYEEGSVVLDISKTELFKSAEAGDFRMNQFKALPEGVTLPDSIAILLGWKAERPGLGAFAQE